jgi:hypothetical protein
MCGVSRARVSKVIDLLETARPEQEMMFASAE